MTAFISFQGAGLISRFLLLAFVMFLLIMAFKRLMFSGNTPGKPVTALKGNPA
jgi:hypothetical protein